MAELDNKVAAGEREVLPEEELTVCLFSIGVGIYALPVELLTEIILSQAIFPVPSAPSHVLGVINLRGNIVPVVDIRPALSLPQMSAPGQIIMIKHGTISLGIIVDHVFEVVGVPEKSVQVVPAEHGKRQRTGKDLSRFLSGIIRRETGSAALLNIERVLEEIKLS